MKFFFYSALFLTFLIQSAIASDAYDKISCEVTWSHDTGDNKPTYVVTKQMIYTPYEGLEAVITVPKDLPYTEGYDSEWFFYARIVGDKFVITVHALRNEGWKTTYDLRQLQDTNLKNDPMISFLGDVDSIKLNCKSL